MIFEFLKKIFKKNNNKILNDNQLIEESNNYEYEDLLLEQYGKCYQLDKHIKILLIADTHNCLTYNKEMLEYIKNEKNYDCCILLGDHSANDLYEIKQYVPNEKLFGVLGNHDTWDKYKDNEIQDINGKVIEINGVKIAGIGGTYKYKDSEKSVLYSQEESIKISDSMKYADILVTHDKPFLRKESDVAHMGLKGITEYLYKNHVSLHIHGHLHECSEKYLKSGTKELTVYGAIIIEI